MKSTPRLAAALGSLLAATVLHAAPSLEEDPFGSNKPLAATLEDNPYFKALPTAKLSVCGVLHKGKTLAIYEHLPIGRGAVGTTVADYTKFTDGKLTGEPWMQSGTFGGMILLRGTSAPSSALEYKGDSMFPLLDGKTFKISLQRANSRLEYSCEDRYAPKRFELKGVRGPLHLVSCMRTTIQNGEARPEKPSYALCNNDLGFCPLHWTGEDGHKQLFEYYEVKGKRFAPVEWRCETAN